MKYFTIALFTTMSASVLGQDINAAIKLFENNQAATSEKIFRSINSDHTSYAQAQYYLGRIAFDKEDFDLAEEYFEEAIDENDSESDYHLWLGNTFGVVAQNANVFKQGLLAPKIKNEYERAVELNDKNEDAMWGLVQYYTQAPGFMGGSYEKAIDMANQIGQVNKLRGYSARITVYSAQEKYNLVEKEYKAAALIEPAWNINLGYFYQQREDYENAFKTFESLATKEDFKWSAYYQIGRTSALSGQRVDRGITCLENYLSHEPEDNQPSHAAAKMRLAMIYEKSGDKTKAVNYYQASLKDDPKMEESKKGLERLGR